MLPQGRFQAFLRARSDERHALLQQVFQTGRFDQVERWLRDRRVALRRASEAQHTLVADLVSRVSEVTGAAAPEGWDGDPASLTAWRDDLAAMTRPRLLRGRTTASSAAAAGGGGGPGGRHGGHRAGGPHRHPCQRHPLAAFPRGRRPATMPPTSGGSSRRGARPAYVPSTRSRRTRGRPRRPPTLRSRQADGSLAELLGEDVIDGAWVTERRREATALLIEIARVQPLEATSLEVERERLTTAPCPRDHPRRPRDRHPAVGASARRARRPAGAARGRSWRLGEGRDAPGTARLADHPPGGRARGRHPDRVAGRGTGGAARRRGAATGRPRSPGGDPRTPPRRHGRRDRLPAGRRRLVPGLWLRRPPVAGHALLRRAGRGRRAARPEGGRRPRGRGRGPHPAGPRSGDPVGRRPGDGRRLGRGALRGSLERHR